MNVLMITGDISTINGENGPFCETLSGLAKHYSQIYVFFPEVQNNNDRNFLPNVKLRSRKLSPIHRFFFFPEIMDFIQEASIDLIVSHDYGLMLNGINAAIIAKKIKSPHISEIFHLEGSPLAANVKEAIFAVWGKIYIRMIKHHISLFRVMNQQIIDDLFLKLKVPHSKVSNINAVYINKKFYFPKKLTKEFDFVFCGRFSSNKGILLILDAVKDLKTMFPNIKIVMIGRGPLFDLSKNYIKRHSLQNNIQLIPRVGSESDLAEYYNKSRFLICASSVEGGPRVVVEALACGIPVISTPVGIVPEVILKGVNGIIFGHSKNELSNTMEKCLRLSSLEYQALTNAAPKGLSRFESKFSMENIFAHYQSVVHSYSVRKTQ